MRANLQKFANSPSALDTQYLLALTLGTLANVTMQTATAKDATAEANYNEAERLLNDIIAKRTDVARAWTVAYVRGLRDYNDAVRNRRGREEIYQILMENTSVKDRAVYDRMVLPGMHPDGELNVASIREALSDFRASGDVKADIDLDQVVDLSFIRYARQVLGPYPR